MLATMQSISDDMLNTAACSTVLILSSVAYSRCGTALAVGGVCMNGTASTTGCSMVLQNDEVHAPLWMCPRILRSFAPVTSAYPH